MSRRRGAFSAFEKTAAQAETVSSGYSPSAPSAPARVRKRTPRVLTLEETKSLLESLRTATTNPDFQKALGNLRGRGWGALKKREAVARLLGLAWKAPLKAIGFSIDQWAFPEALSAVRAHHSQPGIKTLSEEIERQLYFQPGDLFGIKAGALKQTSSAAEAAALTEAEVQVTVTHPTDRDSVVVNVPSSSTMKQVKEALAQKLGRPEITRNGRMVMESPSGDLLPVPDSQRLGVRRQVFMVGISLSAQAPLPTPGAPQATASSLPEPQPQRDRPLNLGEAKELLKAFREISSSKDFQRTLANIFKQGPDAVAKMQPMFIGQSFNQTMAMFDFPLTSEGYQDMARGISKHAWNVHVKAQAHEVERLLRMPLGSFFGIPGEESEVPPAPTYDFDTPSKMQPSPNQQAPVSRSAPQVPSEPKPIREGIQVLARHAVDNAEVRVELPQDATFYDLKQAISKLVGRDEILRKGRLVQKKGGVYSAYKDDDLLGAVRQVLVLGADLRTESEQDDGDDVPPIHPYAAAARKSPAPDIRGKSNLQERSERSVSAPQPYSVNRMPREDVSPPPRPQEPVKAAPAPSPPPKAMPEVPMKKAPPPKPKPPPPPQEYDIIVRHAVESGPEVRLKVWTNWTFEAVRVALAQKLGREDIKRKARFVFREGSGSSPWMSFKDKEVVGWLPDGSRREELMVLGVELVDPTATASTAASIQEAGSDTLSVEKAKILLQEFENACAQEELQEALKKLRERGGIALQLGLTQLMGQAAQKAAESLGLGSSWKLQRIIDGVKEHSSDSQVRLLARGIEKRLAIDAGTLFGMQEGDNTEVTFESKGDSRSQASAIRGLLGRSSGEDTVEHDASNETPSTFSRGGQGTSHGVPSLSLSEALSLQRELHAGFSEPDFQQRLDLLEAGNSQDPRQTLLRQELFLSVQSRVLPKYGFEGNTRGVLEMLDVFNKPELTRSAEFQRLGAELNALLRIPPPGGQRSQPTRQAFPEPASQTQAKEPWRPVSKTQTPPKASRKTPQQVHDVEVVFRHAVEDDHPRHEEAKVTVKSNATMKIVKQALATHLGKPELERSLRLVQRVGENGAFSSFKDTEKLSGRQTLLVLGAPSLNRLGEVDLHAEKVSVEATQVAPAILGKSLDKEATAAPQLTLPQALELQRDLLQGFSNPAFQARRKELVSDLKQRDPKKFSIERQKLFLTVQREVLPKYGFEGNSKGVFDMLQEFDRTELVMNHEFQQQGAVLNQLLFSEEAPKQSRAKSKANKEKKAIIRQDAPPPSDILLTLRHAVEEERQRDEIAYVKVKSNATIKQVKEALAAQLGKPELMRTCRLVDRVGSSGAFASLKDSEVLQGRHSLLVMGAASLLPVAAAEEEPQPKEISTAAKAAKPPPRHLRIDEVLLLQRDLLEGFSDKGFQAKRKELMRTLQETDPRKFSIERQKLFLTVQSIVLPKYGFEGTPKGVFDMMQQFDRPELLLNEDFQRLGAQLNELLFSEDPKNEKTKTRVKDVEVTLRHAVEEGRQRHEEVRVTVRSNATMKQIKEALGVQLGKPDLVQSCRLVERVGSSGAFASFKDSEKIGARRSLLVLGLPSLQLAGEEDEDELQQQDERAPALEPSAPAPAVAQQPQEPEQVKRQARTPAPTLSLDQILSLQGDLLQGFSNPEFQAQRRHLEIAFKDTDPKKFSLERQKLFLTVQRLLLPKYGLEGSPRGVFHMMQQFERPEIMMNDEFQRMGFLLNQLLFGESPEATEASTGKKKTVKAQEEQVVDVEVTLRHAVDNDLASDEEARVMVKSNATMKQVKRALAAMLEQPELAKSLRLVHRVGESGAFASFKDSEKLGSRRSLLVLGVQSLKTNGEEEPVSQPEASPVARARKRQATEKETRELSVSDCIALQKDLLMGFQEPAFQARRKLLQRTLQHEDPRKFSLERQQLFLTVQSAVLPKYGFEGNPKGVFEMMQQFDRPELLQNTEFQRLGWVLNQLLFSEDSEQASSQENAAPAVEEPTLKPRQTQPPRQVEVTLRHAIDDDEATRGEEARVTVKSNATIKQVREALADHLGKPDILDTCRLVQKFGESGAFTSFKDSEKIKGRRAFLVLGVQNLRQSGDGEVEGEGEEEGEAHVTVDTKLQDSSGQSAVAQRASEPSQASMVKQRQKPRPLKVQQLMALQQELLDGFSDSSFQRQLKELQEGLGQTDPKKFRVERQKLFLTVQGAVLPKYGFEGDTGGVFDMLQQFERPEVFNSSDFTRIGNEIEMLLFAGDPEQTSTVSSLQRDLSERLVESKKKSSELSKSKHMQVTLRHAVDEGRISGEQLKLRLKSDASMKEVREALAAALGKQELLHTCRLVRRVGSNGAFASFKDSEKLNGRRTLLVMGVPSLTPGSEPEASVSAITADSEVHQQTAQAGTSGARSLQKKTSSRKEGRQLSVKQAVALQKDLLEGFSSSDFQAKRRELERTLKNSNPRKFSIERQKLFLTVQSVVLPKHGFEGSSKGVFEMMQQLDNRPDFMLDEEFQQLGDRLMVLLFAEEPENQATKKNKVLVDVEITLRHALEDPPSLQGEEAHVTVKSDATFRAVREALADQLGSPDVLKTCRLVRRMGESGAFVSFKDSEKLAGRRSLLVMGLPSLIAADHNNVRASSSGQPHAEEKPRIMAAKAVPTAKQLSVSDALALQQDLLEGFSAPEFLEQLHELQRQSQILGARKFRAERQQLFLTVQSVVLPRHGLAGNTQGVFEMLSQFDRPELTANEDFQRLGNHLNQLLFGGEPEQSAETSGSPASPAAPKEVQVRVKRCMDDEQEIDEAYVTVPETASMLDVKVALARLLGNRELLRKGKLVKKQGGVLVAYKDGELIKGRRRLLFMGPALRAHGSEAAAVENQEHVESESADSEEGQEQPPGTLSVQKARRLLVRVRDACSSADFQSQLKDMTERMKSKGETTAARIGAGALFITACRGALMRAGFEPDRQGYDKMFGAVFPHGQDPAVFALTRDIEHLLGVPAGSWFGITSEQEAVPELSRQEAWELAKEVKRMVASPSFQREVAKTQQRSNEGGPSQMAREIYQPLYQLLRPLALSFRLRGDLECLHRMRVALTPHVQQDTQLRDLLRQVETERLLCLPGSILTDLGPEEQRGEQETLNLEKYGNEHLATQPLHLQQPDTSSSQQLGSTSSNHDQTTYQQHHQHFDVKDETYDNPAGDLLPKQESHPETTPENHQELPPETTDADTQEWHHRIATATQDLPQNHPETAHDDHTEKQHQPEMVDDSQEEQPLIQQSTMYNQEPHTELETTHNIHLDQQHTQPTVLHGDSFEQQLTEPDMLHHDQQLSQGETMCENHEQPQLLDHAMEEQIQQHITPQTNSHIKDQNKIQIMQDGSENSELQRSQVETSKGAQQQTQQGSMWDDPQEQQPSHTETMHYFHQQQHTKPDMTNDSHHEQQEEASVSSTLHDSHQEEQQSQLEMTYECHQEEQQASLGAKQQLEQERDDDDHDVGSLQHADKLYNACPESNEHVKRHAQPQTETPSGNADAAEAEAEAEDAEEEVDEDWDEASGIVDEVAAQISEILVATRRASKKDKPSLLARKRELESSPIYLDALQYLEDPSGERLRRQAADAEATHIVDEVATQITDILAATKSASKKEKPGLLARKRELESSLQYVEALRYLEDPVGERIRRRQIAESVQDSPHH